MRHTYTYTDSNFSANAINTAFAVPCGGSWTMGVWMYDAKSRECVFYSSPVLKKNAHSRNYGPFKTKNKKHEAKIIKNLHIEMVSTLPAYVVVEWWAPGLVENQRLELNRYAFEQWLYETCRLDWCLHEISPSANADNTMSAENYWLYGDYGVTMHDVHTYIIENRLLG